MKRVLATNLEQLGGKAYHLTRMLTGGLPVPPFAVFDFDFFGQEATRAYLDEAQAAYVAGQLSLEALSQQLLDWARRCFEAEDLVAVHAWLEAKREGAGASPRFAVRSSASVEDGQTASFAGQFESQLKLTVAEVPQALQAILLSLYQPSALAYLFGQGLALKEAQMHCIIQEMVEGEVSGIYFTANPKGILNEHIIVLGYGLGDKIVEDRVPTTMVTLHPQDALYYTESKEGAPPGEAQQVAQLQALALEVTQLFGPAMDMEFTFVGQTLYLLQARPITTLPQGQLTILDNSNIVESYPGVTTPLTISFVQEAYASIFRSLAQRLVGKDSPALAAYEPTFQNMLHPVNSRVYYQIQSWYQLLQLLPFSKRIIPIWQEMLGVRETEVPTMPVHLSVGQRLKIMGRLLKHFHTAPQQMAALEARFQAIQAEYQRTFSPDAPPETLMALVQQLKEDILAQWDITLVNDLYAFLYTGLLKKTQQGQTIQAEIAGIEQIESMKPAIALQALAQQLQQPDQADVRLAMIQEDTAVFLARQDPVVAQIRDFIAQYGDRAPEELKLETPTFRTHPERLLALLAEMSQQELKPLALHQAGAQGGTGWWTRFLRKRAMTGVKYRESSRLNRTRIYGMMREIFRALGQQLVQQGWLATVEDVFYLSKDELFDLIRQPRDSRALIHERQAKLEADKVLPTFSRYVFTTQIFEKYLSDHRQAASHLVGQEKLQGIGCSPGTVRGQVLVIEDVQAVQSAQGHIIVTKMTDPGWVYLLTQAKGVIAEQGSLLSHTAIISRELGIPSVVNVQGATHRLQTGDWIEMDGLTGHIRRLTKEEVEGHGHAAR